MALQPKDVHVPTANEFIQEIKEFNHHPVEALIRKAFLFAEDAHKGQKRKSGDDYFVHPLETARILIKLRADSPTITAALLHDAVEDTQTSIEKIAKLFGKDVAHLVEGVTKISGIRFENKEIYNAENMRKILLATTKDIRVMLLKLADRLHNMRTLDHFKPEKQKRIAKETKEIYAPIAEKLGMGIIKGELEDLAFKYLEPESYQKLKKRISEKRKEREKKTKEYLASLNELLKEKDIESETMGRAKYFYSIYKKMKKENKSFEQIYDLIALRIIVKTIPECFRALSVVHELWEPIEGRYKDFISKPKSNGYQSLHTSVLTSDQKIIEVQVRTADMDNIAEEGIAAHWRYKQTERDKKFDQKIMWMKQLLEWKRDSKDTKEFVETLRIDLFENEIVVFTPKGDPITLPEGSTSVDFAFEVHTNIGLTCSKAEVNGKIEPLDHVLRSGDIVNIITQKNAKPSRHWLSFVKTNKAKSKIRVALDMAYDPDEKVPKKEDEEKINLFDHLETDLKSNNIKFSKCCNPELYDPIVAYETKDKKVTIHRKDCPNIHALDQNKQVSIRWKPKEHQERKQFRVLMEDRVGILSDLLNFLTKNKIPLLLINTKGKKDKISVRLQVEVEDDTKLDELLEEVKWIEGVLQVTKENFE
ncbi:RelA/SpoT family protein [Nanoarchaeota archaeon]